jgi:hypothetical protein
MATSNAIESLRAMEVDAMRARLEASLAEIRASAGAAAAEKAFMIEEKALADRLASLGGVDDPSETYVAAFYPGSSPAASAAVVTLDIAEERAGIDLQQQRMPVGRISGSVSAVDGVLPSITQIQLIEVNQVVQTSARTVRATADGRFAFQPVPPGSYLLVASATVRSGSPVPVPAGPALPAAELEKVLQARLANLAVSHYWGLAEISTSGLPIGDVAITLQRGMTISGTVAVDAPGPVDIGRLSLTAIRASTGAGPDLPSPSIAPATVDAQGRFTIRGVPPGSYRIVPSAGIAGLTAKASIFEGRDSLDFPLVVKPGEDVAGGVVTMTSRSTELTGRLQESSGAPASDYTIVVFAADSRFWTPGSRRIQATRPANDGRFAVRSLPPGDYRIVAVTDVENGEWFDPAFLRPLMGASMAITLAEGQRKTQDLQIR